jgi:hypothetical protein
MNEAIREDDKLEFFDKVRDLLVDGRGYWKEIGSSADTVETISRFLTEAGAGGREPELVPKTVGDFTDEDLSDMIVTAFDWVYGACWYWCHIDEGKPNEMLDDNPSAIHIIEEYSGRQSYRVDFDVLRSGIEKILSGRVQVNRQIVAGIEANDIDADAADAIVQAGLFGRLVYG